VCKHTRQTPYSLYPSWPEAFHVGTLLCKGIGWHGRFPYKCLEPCAVLVVMGRIDCDRVFCVAPLPEMLFCFTSDGVGGYLDGDDSGTAKLHVHLQFFQDAC